MVKKAKKKEPRTDRKKNVGKVAEVLIKKPHATTREIAKETGLSVGAVHNSKKEVEQSGTKDPKINYIVNTSFSTIKSIGDINKARVQIIYDSFIESIDENGVITFRKIGKDADGNPCVKLPTVEEMKLLQTIAKDDMQRITVLGGNVTDDQGGLKQTIDLEKATLEQLEAYRQSILSAENDGNKK